MPHDVRARDERVLQEDPRDRRRTERESYPRQDYRRAATLRANATLPGAEFVPESSPLPLSNAARTAGTRIREAWEVPTIRLPLVALAVAMLGVFLPLGSGSGGSASIASAGAAWVYALVIGGLVFAALIYHATEPSRPEWPLTFVMIVSFAFGVLGVLFALGLIVTVLGVNEFGGSASVGPGGVMLPIGIVTVLFSTMRLARDIAIAKAIARAQEARG
jgi:hypothetical protein